MTFRCLPSFFTHSFFYNKFRNEPFIKRFIFGTLSLYFFISDVTKLFNVPIEEIVLKKCPKKCVTSFSVYHTPKVMSEASILSLGCPIGIVLGSCYCASVELTTVLWKLVMPLLLLLRYSTWKLFSCVFQYRLLQRDRYPSRYFAVDIEFEAHLLWKCVIN